MTTTEKTALRSKLNSTKRQGLRKMYAEYMSEREDADLGDMPNIHEYFYIQIKEKYPELDEAGVSIEDVKDLAYSDNQLKFIEQVKSQGFQVEYDYSGRFMFGDVCPAVRVDDIADIRITASYSTDNMGMGYIIYAKS
jgi:hypothetical protein